MCSQLPISWHVQRWSEEEFTGGAWSQLVEGGSMQDRKALGSPISPRLIIAGEACDPDMPAMVHGAAASGCRAARYIFEMMKEEDEVNEDDVEEEEEDDDGDDDDDDEVDEEDGVPEKQYICTTCNKTYTSKSDFKEHNILYSLFHR